MLPVRGSLIFDYPTYFFLSSPSLHTLSLKRYSDPSSQERLLTPIPQGQPRTLFLFNVLRFFPFSPRVVGCGAYLLIWLLSRVLLLSLFPTKRENEEWMRKSYRRDGKKSVKSSTYRNKWKWVNSGSKNDRLLLPQNLLNLWNKTEENWETPTTRKPILILGFFLAWTKGLIALFKMEKLPF